PRSGSGRTGPARLCRVPAGESPRVHLLGAIPEQSPAAAPAAATGTAAGSGATAGVVAGRVGGVRPVWLSHAGAVHADLALCLPAARPRLRCARVPELGRRTAGTVGRRAGPGGGHTGGPGIEPAGCRRVGAGTDRPRPAMASPPGAVPPRG